MIFKIETNFLVRTYEEIHLNPKDYLHCATIEELNNEIEDKINCIIEHPNHSGFEESEVLGVRFWTDDSFYEKWQELKGLPQEL